MKNITQDTIRAIPLPVPSIDDQDRVMKTLAVQLNSSAPISSAVAEQLNTIERLPAAVLRRAFNGGF
jgi:type I restriction enzyme S subunit